MRSVRPMGAAVFDITERIEGIMKRPDAGRIGMVPRPPGRWARCRARCQPVSGMAVSVDRERLAEARAWKVVVAADARSMKDHCASGTTS